MSNLDIETLTNAIERHWSFTPSDKAKVYIGKFFNRKRIGTKIIANMEGNHGRYTVSLETSSNVLMNSACSCYLGRSGSCHHCVALAQTFLQDPQSFVEKPIKKKAEINSLADVKAYLSGVTLSDLIAQLKEKGVTQKAFAEAIGMSTQHLSAIKSSELKNRFYHELGATKLACLWVLEQINRLESKK